MAWPALAQFEVASIKPSNSADEKALLEAVPGRLRIENVTPRTLIVVAYGVAAYQGSGAPSWAESEHYNVRAKAEGNPSVQQMEGPMLQGLLAERFHLAVRRETRQVNAYELRVAGTASKLKASEAGSCVPYKPEEPPPPALKPGEAIVFCGYPHYGVNGTKRFIDGKGVHMSELANLINRFELFAPVLDRTGLPGTFDIHLEWITNTAPDTHAEDGVLIFTALNEQLGLKLERTKADAEIVVIDRIERPTPN
jgi:uncharacterized protein (TIGR03435 family)